MAADFAVNPLQFERQKSQSKYPTSVAGDSYTPSALYSTFSKLPRTSKQLFAGSFPADGNPQYSTHSGDMQAVVNDGDEVRRMTSRKRVQEDAFLPFIDGSLEGDGGRGGTKLHSHVLKSKTTSHKTQKFSLKPAIFSPAFANVPIAGNQDHDDVCSESSQSSDSENEYYSSSKLRRSSPASFMYEDRAEPLSVVRPQTFMDAHLARLDFDAPSTQISPFESSYSSSSDSRPSSLGVPQRLLEAHTYPSNRTSSNNWTSGPSHDGYDHSRSTAIVRLPVPFGRDLSRISGQGSHFELLAPGTSILDPPQPSPYTSGLQPDTAPASHTPNMSLSFASAGTDIGNSMSSGIQTRLGFSADGIESWVDTSPPLSTQSLKMPAIDPHTSSPPPQCEPPIILSSSMVDALTNMAPPANDPVHNSHGMTSPRSPTEYLSLTSPVTAPAYSSSCTSLPPPPWASRPPKPSPSPSHSPSTTKKRKRTMAETYQNQHVARTRSPTAARTVLESVIADGTSASGMNNLTTSSRPVIMYRLRTADMDNGTINVVLKEDYMANFLQNKAYLVEEKVKKKEKDRERRMGKKVEEIKETSLDADRGRGSVRAIYTSFGSVASAIRPPSLPASSDTSRALEQDTQPLTKAELRKSTKAELRRLANARKAELKQEKHRQKIRELEEKVKAAEEYKRQLERQRASVRPTKVQRRTGKVEEREKAKKEKIMKEQRTHEAEKAERLQREQEMQELLALKERLFEARALRKHGEEGSALNRLADNPTPASEVITTPTEKNALGTSETVNGHPFHGQLHTSASNFTQHGTLTPQLATPNQSVDTPYRSWEQEQSREQVIHGERIAKEQGTATVPGADSKPAPATSWNHTAVTLPGPAEDIVRQCVVLHPRVTSQNANAVCALNSSNMETSVTENLILDCVSQQGDGEDINFVLVQSSDACEETRVVKSPEPVQYNSPSSTANPGAQSMSLSQASTPTKIHQPRPLYFTSDMFPRTSLLSPFVPPLPLKTKSVDSPSAENPSFISNTDCLPFRKQRFLPTTITSAMDKAKSSGTKCRPMPRVASFPACQESGHRKAQS
ncbi:hypothetical protein EV359DRAFT_82197 [Lentinula novae-zelandiae]|nr:hypothetical protein EV359DRAFT_82197 [Lentinula novae-zelandiae]